MILSTFLSVMIYELQFSIKEKYTNIYYYDPFLAYNSSRFGFLLLDP